MTTLLRLREFRTPKAPYAALINVLWWITTLIYTSSFVLVILQLDDLGNTVSSLRKVFILARWTVGILILIAGLLLNRTALVDLAYEWGLKARRQLHRFGGWNLVVFSLWILIYPVVISGPYRTKIPNLAFRLLIFWLLALGGAEWLKAAWPKARWIGLFMASMVAIGFLYSLAGFLPNISNNPFSLGWSEGSQYYSASLWFSQQDYGMKTPLSVLNPAVDLLLSIPFIFPGLPIWIHRLWTVVLWVGVTLWGAAILQSYQKGASPLGKVVFIGLAFIYILQLPVYFHLLLCVIVVLHGFRSKNGIIRLASVLAASGWAGLARVNWIPLPALLAVSIYLIETPIRGNLWDYIRQPLLWIVTGGAAALASNLLFMAFSGNPTDFFTTSFTSQLLWYRLLPSAVNPLGILLQILLISAPLVWVILHCLGRGPWGAWHWGRLGGLGAILLAFFVGGTIISVKIGGGNNAHNYDAYISLLLVICSLVVWENFEKDKDIPEAGAEKPWALPASASFAIFLIIMTGQVVSLTSSQGSYQAELQVIRDAIREIQQQNPQGEILFISERQLLTFDAVQGVRLVPEYEKMMLMEMAMAGNHRYLNHFYGDIRKHRFALIISEILNPTYIGNDRSFQEENNIWVKWIAVEILKEYQPIYPNPNVHLLVPKID